MIVKHCINANCPVLVSKVLKLYLHLTKERSHSCQAEFIHDPSGNYVGIAGWIGGGAMWLC